MRQFEMSDAECLVSGCANCANALVSYAEGPYLIYHYLELLFGVEIEWSDAVRALEKLNGEDSENMALPLDEDNPLLLDDMSLLMIERFINPQPYYELTGEYYPWTEEE